jgi:hypothetical protein
VAHLAVVVVFYQVNLMAEHDRLCILEGELDVLGLGRSGADGAEHDYRKG